MRKEAFKFITELIRVGKPGVEITRAQVTKYMLGVYKPGIKDSAQATCRQASDTIFAFYVRKGILKRIGRGKYEIIAPPSVPIVYEKIYKELR